MTAMALPSAFPGTLAARGTITQVLAQTNDPGGHGDDFGKSSPVGLLLLVLFFIAVVFLVRSMNKHLKRVPASFGADAGTGDRQGGTEATGGTPGSTSTESSTTVTGSGSAAPRSAEREAGAPKSDESGPSAE